MLSPVCTPIGSMFSMLHTVMQLSAASRITSYSISFHPTRDFSRSTWSMGLAASPEPNDALELIDSVGDASPCTA